MVTGRLLAIRSGVMKRAGVAVGVALLLALAGCAAPATETAPEPEVEVSEEATDELVAETPEVEDALTPEDAYLEMLRPGIEASSTTQIGNATDDQLIQAGHDACEQLADGTDSFDVRVVEGEQPTEVGYADSFRIAAVALEHLCPEARD
jgi:hypothetical protein